MQNIILDIVASLFGAGVGIGIHHLSYRRGFEQGYKTAESECASQSEETEKHFKMLSNIMKEFCDLKPATPPSSPANENKSDNWSMRDKPTRARR